MPARATVTIPLTPELEDRLGRLARGAGRSREGLAAEAVAAYVDRALDIVAGVQQGLDDVAAGRVVAHDDAMDELDAVIEAAAGRRQT